MQTMTQSVSDILAERARQARERLDQWETVCAVAEDDPAFADWCVWREILTREAAAAESLVEDAR